MSLHRWLHQSGFIGLLVALCVGCQSTRKHGYESQPYGSRYARIIEESVSSDNEALSKLDTEALTQYLDKYFPEDLESKYDFPIVQNQRVDKWIRYFTSKGRKWFQGALNKGLPYIPHMRDILETNGLPGDLVYLALIESGFKHTIRSHKNAVGTWQFLKSTGKGHGLEIDVWVDERHDPIKATEAAAAYLNKLHDVFKSYYLALAAYNTGPGRVLRAITRHKTRNYWKLRTLPRETLNYVPKLIAAIILAKNPEQYGFSIDKNPKTLEFATIATSKPISLVKLARQMGIAPRYLKNLNAELRYAITPPGKKNYEIKVPPHLKDKALASLPLARARLPFNGFMNYYVRRGDSLYRIAREHGTKVSTLMSVNRLSYRQARRLRIGKKLIIPTTHIFQDKRIHRVRRGESLWSISRRYRTTIQALKQMNNIASVIKPGQKLIIPQRFKRMHTVAQGDTLWKISKRYRTTVRQLKRANQISNFIKPGQRLIIPQSG